MTEHSWLSLLDAEPLDLLALDAYADWLEERGEDRRAWAARAAKAYEPVHYGDNAAEGDTNKEKAMAETKKEVFLARFVRERLAGPGTERAWSMFDAAGNRLDSNKSRRELVDRWKAVYGDFQVLTRFAGVMRASELAMTIADVRGLMDRPKEGGDA